MTATSAAPTPVTARRRVTRAQLAVAVAVLLALVVAVWSTRGSEKYPGAADPRNPGPDGAQAIAKVLADQGVDVTIARSADAFEEATVDDRTTVVVSSTEQLAPSTLRRMRGAPLNGSAESGACCCSARSSAKLP